MNRCVKQLIEQMQQYSWGAWGLISLYISIVSGIIVGLQYDLTTPYYSVTALDLLVPYGDFFRSAHFYSSQFFFFFAVSILLLFLTKLKIILPRNG